ncbi:hypothetical protein IJI72_03325 [Candidatus Saccharibacteria bacterium]|nr:hypothetical protein [Candidatus Saccharibacteria bacterium]
MKYAALLGRLPSLSMTELEKFYPDVRQVYAYAPMHASEAEAAENRLAIFTAEKRPEIRRFGGVLKFGEEITGGEKGIISYLNSLPEGKIVLGVSDFRNRGGRRRAQEEALKLKRILQRSGRSVRVLENKEAVLSTATSHHNQLAEKKNHVEIMLTDVGNFKLIGVQNITEYAKRDQARPARDAKVGMLPPKLAQMLINRLGELPEGSVILDPFCGTGVVLQEALLMRYRALGTDKEPRMVEYSRRNLEWLSSGKSGVKIPEGASMEFETEPGDATEMDWRKSASLKKLGGKIDGVVAEVFLGSPMSKVPTEMKLKEEKERCRGILIGFLKNLAGQIERGTGVVLAVPAWRRENGEYETLGILDEVQEMGYNLEKFRKSRREDLLYYREGQIVARQIIVLRKK